MRRNVTPLGRHRAENCRGYISWLIANNEEARGDGGKGTKEVPRRHELEEETRRDSEREPVHFPGDIGDCV